MSGRISELLGMESKVDWILKDINIGVAKFVLLVWNRREKVRQKIEDA